MLALELIAPESGQPAMRFGQSSFPRQREDEKEAFRPAVGSTVGISIGEGLAVPGVNGIDRRCSPDSEHRRLAQG
ncbi:MAG: hypothetical protein F9K30_09395 [Dechloromonas sp.]|nr:MAG: hypothetical protein F9K30_09395 [Dechloromonas sp.]